MRSPALSATSFDFISHSRGYASLTASANTAFPRGAVRGNFRTRPPDHAARRCSRRPSDLRRRAALPPERSRERRKAVTAASSALILSMFGGLIAADALFQGLDERPIEITIENRRVNVTFAADGDGVPEMPRNLFGGADQGGSACLPAARASSRKAKAARNVPAQVRKSLAVISSPLISRKYALTSEDPTVCRWPSSPTYWKSSCPGRSRQRLTMRAKRRSLTRLSFHTPLLPRNARRIVSPLTAACQLRSVVRPKLLLAFEYSLLPMRKSVSSRRRTIAASTRSRCSP